MTLSRNLIHHLMRFRGVDTKLFESEAEWDLAIAILESRLAGISETQLAHLEELAQEISTSRESGL